MRLAFFGGSFDPFHLGHLNIIIHILKRDDIDQVLVCPAAVSPFKNSEINADMRLAMVQSAIGDLEGAVLCDLEVKRGGTSFTIDTLDSIGGDIRLVIATDLVHDFDKWKEAKRIVTQYNPIVVPRAGYDLSGLEGCEQYQIPLMEISSTDIRDRLKKSLPCEGLLPQSVVNFIRENKLYT